LDSAAIGGKKKETKGKKARKGKGKSDGHDEGDAGADAERFEVSEPLMHCRRAWHATPLLCRRIACASRVRQWALVRSMRLCVVRHRAEALPRHCRLPCSIGCAVGHAGQRRRFALRPDLLERRLCTRSDGATRCDELQRCCVCHAALQRRSAACEPSPLTAGRVYASVPLAACLAPAAGAQRTIAS
jgi:hypothetical protein